MKSLQGPAVAWMNHDTTVSVTGSTSSVCTFFFGGGGVGILPEMASFIIGSGEGRESKGHVENYGDNLCPVQMPNASPPFLLKEFARFGLQGI